MLDNKVDTDKYAFSLLFITFGANLDTEMHIAYPVS